MIKIQITYNILPTPLPLKLWGYQKKKTTCAKFEFKGALYRDPLGPTKFRSVHPHITAAGIAAVFRAAAPGSIHIIGDTCSDRGEKKSFEQIGENPETGKKNGTGCITFLYRGRVVATTVVRGV